MKKITMLLAGAAILGTVAFVGCQKDINNPSLTSDAGKKSAMDVVTLSSPSSTQTSIDLTVTAGATGAPAGFSIQWMKKADLDALGGVWPQYDALTGNFCKASFSGNAFLARYNLAPGASVTVTIGALLFDNGASATCTDPLNCSSDYVFRAFAHATNKLNRSAYTPTFNASTTACSVSDCRQNVAFYKNNAHSPVNDPSVWPATLTVGGQLYTAAELYQLLNTPAAGNGLVLIAHQVIVAKLNAFNGALYTADETSCINSSDQWIDDNSSDKIAPIGTATYPIQGLNQSTYFVCLIQTNNAAGNCQ